MSQSNISQHHNIPLAKPNLLLNYTARSHSPSVNADSPPYNKGGLAVLIIEPQPKINEKEAPLTKVEIGMAINLRV